MFWQRVAIQRFDGPDLNNHHITRKIEQRFFSILMKIFLPLLVQIGSFFTRADNVGTPVEVMAQNARMGSRKLQSLSPAERAEAINFIADALVDRQEELLRVNKKDLAKVSYFLRLAKEKYASIKLF